LFTPSTGHILPGITRATVLEICSRHNIPVTEKRVGPEEIKGADAAFFCGTAAEVIGWESFDDIPFKLNWADSIGRFVQGAYHDIVVGNAAANPGDSSSLQPAELVATT
jgi:branched-chain amino acid aminotransferase